MKALALACLFASSITYAASQDYRSETLDGAKICRQHNNFERFDQIQQNDIISIEMPDHILAGRQSEIQHNENNYIDSILLGEIPFEQRNYEGFRPIIELKNVENDPIQFRASVYRFTVINVGADGSLLVKTENGNSLSLNCGDQGRATTEFDGCQTTDFIDGSGTSSNALGTITRGGEILGMGQIPNNANTTCGEENLPLREAEGSHVVPNTGTNDITL